MRGPPGWTRHNSTIFDDYSAIRRLFDDYSTLFDYIRQYSTLFDIFWHFSSFFDIRHFSPFFDIQHFSTFFRQHSTALDIYSTVENCRTVPKFVENMLNDVENVEKMSRYILGGPHWRLLCLIVVAHCGSLGDLQGSLGVAVDRKETFGACWGSITAEWLTHFNTGNIFHGIAMKVMRLQHWRDGKLDDIWKECQIIQKNCRRREGPIYIMKPSPNSLRNLAL